MWELVLSVFGFMLVLGTNITSMLVLTDVILKHRHSYKVIIIYVIVKSLIINVGCNMLFSDLIETNKISQGIYLILVSVTAILTYLVMLYTYDEDFAKIAIICSATELIAMLLGNIGLAVSNLITGEELLSTTGILHATDVVIPLISWTLLFSLIKIGEPLWEKLRRWEVKHKKTIMTVFCIYIGFSIMSMFLSLDDYDIVFTFFCGIVAPAILIAYVNFFDYKTKQENEALKKRQSLTMMQYKAVVLEMKKMEQMQSKIETQMRTIVELSETAENKTEQIEQYIVSLKKHSEAIATGIFCDDWVLDSVLYHTMKACENKGIRTVFYLQGYQKNLNESEEFANYVRMLLDEAMDKTEKELSLRIATVKGRNIIKISCDGEEDTRFFS